MQPVQPYKMTRRLIAGAEVVCMSQRDVQLAHAVVAGRGDAMPRWQALAVVSFSKQPSYKRGAGWQVPREVFRKRARSIEAAAERHESAVRTGGDPVLRSLHEATAAELYGLV